MGGQGRIFRVRYNCVCVCVCVCVCACCAGMVGGGGSKIQRIDKAAIHRICSGQVSETVWNRNSLPFNFVCPNAAAASYGFSLSKTLTW